jgi:hypothetical protein
MSPRVSTRSASASIARFAVFLHATGSPQMLPTATTVSYRTGVGSNAPLRSGSELAAAA